MQVGHTKSPRAWGERLDPDSEEPLALRVTAPSTRRQSVLLVDREPTNASASASALDELAEELAEHDLSLVTASAHEDILSALAPGADVAVVLIRWDPRSRSQLVETIDRIQERSGGIPVLLLASGSRVSDVPLDLAERARGFFWLDEDTPAFVAGRIKRLTRARGDRPVHSQEGLPPFFGALMRYTEDYNWNWSCPGHQGGMFYRKTALGRAYFDFVGENILRADLCNASVELGSLLHHQGPILEAERLAADVFGAERTYFVLNGTSSANKMVTLGLLSPGDLVLFDRNCHKSMHHGALMLGGALPVYLNPTRGASGVIGPIAHHWLEEEYIRERIRSNPLVTDEHAWQRERPFRLAILTNTTYDGICYDARTVISRIGALCDYVIFDEAWMAYAKFHPLYRGRFAMDLGDLAPGDPGIYATQSTHKCLAGLSQASQIHVRDSHLGDQPRRLEHDRFNEVFMMHTSTSPQYNLIASLDVGAAIMRGAHGVALVDEAIRESIALRRQIIRYGLEIAARGDEPPPHWFFGVFGPSIVSASPAQLREAMDPRLTTAARDTLEQAVDGGGVDRSPWLEVSEDVLANVPACWLLSEGDDWHDLAGLAPGYVMLDPTKCTITTPGVSDAGALADWGIPAAIPAAVLRARGTVTEKTSFYTMLVLITAAIERGKSASLLSELLDFKHLYDRGASLREALPELVASHPDRYSSLSLRDLCDQMHSLLRQSKADLLQREAFSAAHAPEIAISPAQAHAELVAGRVDLVPLRAAAGRIAATLIVAYPPGIGVIVPGERFAPDSAALAYLQMFEQSDNLFPGFESEIQGVYRRPDVEGVSRHHTYVVSDASPYT